MWGLCEKKNDRIQHPFSPNPDQPAFGNGSNLSTAPPGKARNAAILTLPTATGLSFATLIYIFHLCADSAACCP